MRRVSRSSAFHGYRIGRRRFLADIGLGFTGLALGALLFEDGIAATSLPRIQARHRPRLRRRRA